MPSKQSTPKKAARVARKKTSRGRTKKPTSRRGGRHSKGKGSAFERQIARALSLWLTDDTDDKQLIRSVGSGGWVPRVTEHDEAWRHVGDLAPNGPHGEWFRRRFAVECKHYRAIDLWALWTRAARPGTIHGWWKKIVKEASDAGLEPMLIFRANQLPIMVAMPTRLARCVTGHQRADFTAFDFSILPFAALIAVAPGVLLPAMD